MLRERGDKSRWGIKSEVKVKVKVKVKDDALPHLFWRGEVSPLCNISVLFPEPSKTPKESW